MPGTKQPTDPQTIVKQYMRRNAKVAEALKTLKITPAEYSRVIASRMPRTSR